MGEPGWISDERFATRSAREAHPEALDALIETWTSQHPAQVVMDRLHLAPTRSSDETVTPAPERY